MISYFDKDEVGEAFFSVVVGEEGVSLRQVQLWLRLWFSHHYRVRSLAGLARLSFAFYLRPLG